MKKITIDLYLDDDVFKKVKGIYETKERRKNLSYLISQLVNLSLKRLSEDDLILILLLGQKIRKLEYRKNISVLEDIVISFSERFNRLLDSITDDVKNFKKKKEKEREFKVEDGNFRNDSLEESFGVRKVKENKKEEELPNLRAFLL